MAGNKKTNKPKLVLSGRAKAMKKGQTLFLFAMLILPTLGFFLNWVTVNINAILLAFKDQEGAFSMVNFQDFWALLTNPYGATLGLALKNTTKYWVVGVFFNLPMSVIIAYFLYKKIALYKSFRVIFFFPCIVTGMIMVSAYTMIVNPGGPWDKLLRLFGGSVPSWGYFNDASTATNTILVYCIWMGAGTNMILAGSAMARIPDSVIEAAKLDGCGPFRELIQIVLPLIWPTLATMILLTFTSFLATSGPILLFAPDGQADTTTINFWMYKQVFGAGEFGSSGGTGKYGLLSATGLVFTVVWMPVVLFVRWLTNLVPDVEY